jgi:hypothetical protein
MMRTAFLLGAAVMVAACASDGRRALAQDLGVALTKPIEAAVPQVGRSLRSGISDTDPARILVIGDSLSQGFGALMQDQAAARGLPVTVTNRGRPSTGLARADFYNWPANFENMATAMQPDILVAHFGANDMQTIQAPEGRAGFGTPQWDDSYRVQIRKILELAARDGIIVYLIGPGPDGNRNLNAHLGRINPLFEEEAERAGAVYFPVTPFTTPPSGAFARHVVIDGRNVAMRTADGSHFTWTGYRLVADRIFDAMIAQHSQLGNPKPDGGGLLAVATVQ